MSSAPLVFLHGFMGSRLDWDVIVERLGGLSREVIALDLPGHGEQAIGVESVGYASLFRWLLGELDRRGLGRVVLVGYSMGGRVALYTALSCPERVEVLVLEGAGPGLEDEAERRERARVDRGRAERVLRVGMPVFLEEWYQMPFFESLRARGAVFERMMARRVSNRPEWVARVVAEMSPGVQPALWFRLPELSVPVVWISGAGDLKYRRIGERLASLVPDCQMHVVEGAGHNVHLEAPERFVGILLERFS